MNKQCLDELKEKYSLKLPDKSGILITASSEERDYKIVVNDWDDVLPTILDYFDGSYNTFKKLYSESYEEAGNMLVEVSFTMGLKENDEINHFFSAEIVELNLYHI